MQELLTSSQVAERCGVSRQSVGNWVEWGWLKPAYDLPTGRLFTVAGVDKVSTPAKRARIARLFAEKAKRAS